MNRLPFVSAAVLVLALLASPPTAHARRLWIIWDSGTDVCMSETLAWYDCLLHHTTFNAMIAEWPAGETITDVAGTATISSATASTCGSSGWQCLVDAAGFHMATHDVLIHFWWGSGCVNGHNHWHTHVSNGVTHTSTHAT